VHFEGKTLYDICDICGNNINANEIANNTKHPEQPETQSQKSESPLERFSLRLTLTPLEFLIKAKASHTKGNKMLKHLKQRII